MVQLFLLSLPGLLLLLLLQGHQVGPLLLQLPLEPLRLTLLLDLLTLVLLQGWATETEASQSRGFTKANWKGSHVGSQKIFFYFGGYFK